MTSVDAWLVRPSTAVDEDCVSPAERRAAAAMRTSARTSRHLRSRAVLRHVVAAATGVDPGDVALEAPPGEQPRLLGARAPGVSLAHSGGVIAVALSPDGPVGIDVEVTAVRRRPVPAAVVPPRRQATVVGLVPDRLLPWGVWVALEAALKAAGVGFRFPHRGAHLEPRSTGLDVDLGDRGSFGVALRTLPDGTVLGVATTAEVPAVRWLDLVQPVGFAPPRRA